MSAEIKFHSVSEVVVVGVEFVGELRYFLSGAPPAGFCFVGDDALPKGESLFTAVTSA